MKVQTRIFLLLAATVVIFVAALSIAKQVEKRNFDRILAVRAKERIASFDGFMRHRGAPLEMMTKDFTYWDDLVRSLASQDRDWVANNLGDTPLNTYGANALWILRADLSPFYAHNNLYASNLTEVPMPRSAIPSLFAAQKFCHFFVRTPQGLMEIRGATVHPSQDSSRTTPARGYLFAGQLWSNESVREMALFTGNDVRLTGEPPPAGSAASGTVSFSRELDGWDGRPLAYLAVKNDAPAVAELNSFTESLFLWVIGFALVLLALLAGALFFWVSLPLKLIADSLNQRNVAPLRHLKNESSEFGTIAQLIHHFFEQRTALINEMEERRGAEAALERSEEQLRQSQKMEAVGQLAGGVAHDFNNLLTAIIGYSDLLLDRVRGDRVSLQCAEMVRMAGDQAASLTRQLLAFSRKQILQPRVLEVSALVTNMEKLLRRLIGEHIELRTIIDAKDARIKADPGQLEQVLLNLGVNARDAMPQGGVLTIRTALADLGDDSSRVQAGLSKGEYVLIAVSDTGEGMSKETQQHIFEPFFTTKNPGKGTGLGLATVYGIVKQSGGGISVESAVGHGTSFRIYLPREHAPVDPPRAAVDSVAPTKKCETLLVVEDEEIVRKLVCDVLEKYGYRVLCAERGSEALRMAAETAGPIHLLITDVVMPEMSGPELARRLTLVRPETRVLYVSGYSEEELHAPKEFEIEVLQKPFAPHVLAQRVRDLLASRPSYAIAD